jgi:hypothetical protein
MGGTWSGLGRLKRAAVRDSEQEWPVTLRAFWLRSVGQKHRRGAPRRYPDSRPGSGPPACGASGFALDRPQRFLKCLVIAVQAVIRRYGARLIEEITCAHRMSPDSCIYQNQIASFTGKLSQRNYSGLGVSHAAPTDICPAGARAS